MKVVIFCHSLVSDWNHGNAHFLRGIVTELQDRGHDVDVLEPEDGWSRENLLRSEGEEPLRAFHERFPHLRSTAYRSQELNLGVVLDRVDLVLVHEWTDNELIEAIGRHHRTLRGYRLLFHDTHHRAASTPHEMDARDLSGYDGVLAFGRVIRDIYLKRGWARRAWTWHEAADVRTFHPLPEVRRDRDLVWIGNWGDEQRSEELIEFLLEPARSLAVTGTIHGVRYPKAAQRTIADSGLEYRGWLANHEVPSVFARHRVTVHVPRRPYVRRLPGIPTIRPFEALACGIPLVSAPWNDVEGLFAPGEDFLVAADREEMTAQLKRVLHDDELAHDLAERGRRTILERHTCAHRVDELLQIYEEIA
jgi:spore maturation protein CgeB